MDTNNRRDDMDNESSGHKVAVNRNLMRALWRITKRVDPGRRSIFQAALRVTESGATWEATNGACALMVPWKFDDEAGDHGLEPGVYVAAARDLERRASIPARVWRPTLDGLLPLDLESSETRKYDRWPDIPQVLPPAEAHPEPASFIGFDSALLCLVEQVAKDLKLGRRHGWKARFGAVHDAVSFKSERDNGPTMIVMPLRLD